MKTKNYIITMIALIVFSFVSNEAQQWVRLMPTFYPSGDYVLYYGTFVDQNNGWFVDYYSGRIFHSSDMGHNWYLQRDSIMSAKNFSWDIYFADSIYGWVLAANIDSTYLLKTTDSGVSWNRIETPSFINIYFTDRNNGIGVGSAGIYYSNDGGENWEKCIYSDIEKGIRAVTKILFLDKKVGLIMLEANYSWEGDKVLLKTIDGGYTWESLSGNLPQGITDLFMLDSLRWYVCAPTKSIWYSSDGGNNWIPKNSTGASAIYFIDECKGLGVGGFAGISQTTDCLNSWEKIVSEVHQLSRISYRNSEHSIYVFGFNDTIYFNANIVNVEYEEETLTPNDFILYQNYPNPFNPTTTISYSLPEAGNIQIKIFDVLGREVAKLVDETKSAGKYSVAWNGSINASGIYFYTITFNNQTLYKKMLMIK